MNKYIAVLMAALLPGGLAAQSLPSLFNVTGVAADDVLNIRENPRGSASVIGTIAPDATGIEVVELSESGNWGHVNSGEGSGWASMEFLSPQPDQGEAYFESSLVCFGTEPFWNLRFPGDGTAVLTRPDASDVTLPVDLTTISSNAGTGVQAVHAVEYAVGLTGIARRQICSV